ncbi:undecaprenyl-phosphate glucose phosphotransferase [Flavobacterium sp. CYK-55]|uniref:undecaprenyl-phosphate glucose phosphotransferase n=1 Tax=Flavobacterium sp. CYK-55 TaxID=2835529 RepID=UPI001BCFD240|nr:undecaprenyl-phosphate glucose phosphotransferase [Flavobacterium sp. CYK-55]MBS7787527.1 undecaprenyl-phosphate glucose phosphotransferase [Flavobacterium sp. CYK-55]
MRHKIGRYSSYIRPFSYILDLIIINLFSYLILPGFFSEYFILFASISWMVIAINVEFYEVYRFTKVLSIINKLFKQFTFFTILCFAYSGFYVNSNNWKSILIYGAFSFITVFTLKLSIFFFLRKYRVLFGGNFRRVVIVGSGKNVSQLTNFFNDNPDYGYQLVGSFSLEEGKKDQIQESFTFVLNENIDEIYCSLANLTNEQIDSYIDFSDNNLKKLKFLPDDNEVFSRNLKIDYYGYIPVASLRNIPLDDIINQFVKRVFDIIFSSVIILGILSWLTPILALLIKIESRGPIFFKQKRNGLNYHEFNCYKFRSMNLNEIADLEQVSKNDPRITKIGKFIRKTSIDELPQFFNVLLGDMSVVGPRPHMVSHTEMYARKVDKFMVRHFIKPGITGLAQTNGYRGEVETDKDIINRVKYDIFYIENWSLLLDLKIIFMTVYNAVRGEEKAY